MPLLGRRPELHRHQHGEHEAEPEEGRRVAEQGDDRDHRVAQRPGPARRGDAEDDAADQGDAERAEHQEQRRREARQDQLHHRLVVAERMAEVQRRERAEVAAEAHRQRLVEAELLAQRGEVGGVGRARLAGHHVDHVARRGVDDQEVGAGDQHQHQQRLREPPQQVAAHGVNSPRGLTSVPGRRWRRCRTRPRRPR
jgi:hypothetical protein